MAGSGVTLSDSLFTTKEASHSTFREDKTYQKESWVYICVLHFKSSSPRNSFTIQKYTDVVTPITTVNAGSQAKFKQREKT